MTLTTFTEPCPRTKPLFDMDTVPFEFDMQERDTPASLRSEGLIRANGVIDIALNERLKALARKQGRNADQLIGELITRSAGEVDRLEAEQEAVRLRERFGDRWLDLLKQIEE